MGAHRLGSIGAGVTLTAEASAQMPRLLRKALTDTSLSQAAQAFASRYQGYDQNKTIRTVADRCEAAVRSRP